MLPPLTMATTGSRRSRDSARWSAPSRAAATLAAPLGSATIFACSNVHRTASDDLRIVHGDHAVDKGLHVRKGQIARSYRHEPVGHALGVWPASRVTGFERGLHRRCADGLDADHAYRGLRLLDGRGDARGQAAAADREPPRRPHPAVARESRVRRFPGRR